MTNTTIELKNPMELVKLGKDQVQILEIEGLPVLVTPEHLSVNFQTLAELDEFRETPRHLEASVELHTAQSFIDYVNDYADANTAIFVDEENAKFVAVLDYHKDTTSPRHCNHTATFQCKKTDEWSVWMRHDCDKMSQEEFALFIEDNADEIASPSSAEMLEIALTIKANTTCEFRQSQRLDNGQVQLTYNEVIDGRAGAAGQLEIPQEITIGMQPFQGSESYTRKARFRYRINHGKLAMWYDLLRPNKCIEEAVKDTLSKIKNPDNGVKVSQFYFGIPPR
tara:strand:+ start:32046 stop:32888 length:843 start_codon:yes stop_codon:yes gene_type:complete